MQRGRGYRPTARKCTNSPNRSVHNITKNVHTYRLWVETGNPVSVVVQALTITLKV